jgi:hypothetical protein
MAPSMQTLDYVQLPFHWKSLVDLPEPTLDEEAATSTAAVVSSLFPRKVSNIVTTTNKKGCDSV